MTDAGAGSSDVLSPENCLDRQRCHLGRMVKMTGEYQGELHCTATHGPSGTALATDAPKDNHGRGESFSPTDLLATSLATCIATTMALVAGRHQVDLKGLRYEVTKEMAADAPRRISRLAVDIWLPPAARQVPAGLLEQAAHGCPVHHSLAPGVEMPITLHWA
jgi:putative redox protein